MKAISYRLFFKAIANDRRLAIVNLLKSKPRNVTEITKALRAKQPTISRSLKCLQDCGFITVRRKGKEKIYALEDKTVRECLNLIEKHLKRYKSHLVKCGILKG